VSDTVSDGEVLRNVATVSSDDYDIAEDDYEEVTVTIPDYEAAVTIVKTANPTVVLAGESIDYTLIVTNTGNVLLTSLVVTDNLPIQLVNPRILALPLGATGDFTGNLLRVTLAALAPGESVTITFTTTVSTGTASGTSIINTANVTDKNTEVTDDDNATVVVAPRGEPGDPGDPSFPDEPGDDGSIYIPWTPPTSPPIIPIDPPYVTGEYPTYVIEEDTLHVTRDESTYVIEEDPLYVTGEGPRPALPYIPTPPIPPVDSTDLTDPTTPTPPTDPTTPPDGRIPPQTSDDFTFTGLIVSALGLLLSLISMLFIIVIRRKRRHESTV
jgi:uncharacterized repeat protein (TIGR01451 family)